MKRIRICAVLALVASVVSLSGCDAMFGDANDGGCHINDAYEIHCEGDAPGLQTP